LIYDYEIWIIKTLFKKEALKPSKKLFNHNFQMKFVALFGLGVAIQCGIAQADCPTVCVDWDKDCHGEAVKNNVKGEGNIVDGINNSVEGLVNDIAGRENRISGERNGVRGDFNSVLGVDNRAVGNKNAIKG
jgi:hypothetical protein